MKNISQSDILILLFCIFFIFLFLNKFCTYEEFNNIKIKIYNFNTTWCGHSLKFQPIWDLFIKSLNKSDNIVAYDVKCNDNKKEGFQCLYTAVTRASENLEILAPFF